MKFRNEEVAFNGCWEQRRRLNETTATGEDGNADHDIRSDSENPGPCKRLWME